MNKAFISILILVVFYIVGIIGISLPLHPDFALLTPLNLLLSTSLLLWNHDEWTKGTYIFLISAYLIGFLTELYGVQTGILFGEYEYGKVLGPKLWETPLMIGVNWMMLGYAIGVSTQYVLFKVHWIIQTIMSALIMVGLDWFIEPVAIKYGFWSWANESVPLQNYIGWFMVSLVVLAIFHIFNKAIKNKVAIALLLLQFVFFITLNIL